MKRECASERLSDFDEKRGRGDWIPHGTQTVDLCQIPALLHHYVRSSIWHRNPDLAISSAGVEVMDLRVLAQRERFLGQYLTLIL